MEKIPKIDTDGIEFDLLDNPELEAVVSAANQLLGKVFDNSAGKEELNPDHFWPSLRGYRPDKTRLVIKPLDRVGSEPGFSGTRVLIANFIELEEKEKPKNKIENTEIHPSRPLVMKIGKPDRGTGECKLKDELNEEYDVARWIKEQEFEKHDEEAFAWPLDIYPAPSPCKCSVLWSAFYSSTKPFDLSDRSKLFLTQRGLYSVLAGDMAIGWKKRADAFSNNLVVRLEETFQTIDHVFRCLKALHWHGKKGPTVSEERKCIVPEYRKYLRGFKEEGKWGDAWRQIWGSENNKDIKGKHNPVRVLKQLESASYNICVGAIHGDLHPRNIVFSHDRSPHIIDFGWARQETHIAKDFALMECNLRFMVLRPDILNKTLKALVEWIPFHNEFTQTRHPYVDGVAEIIKKLHELAKEHFPKKNKQNWNKEYVVPLFLTALGLLKPNVFSSCHNRVAAILTVQNLADYLGREMDAGRL